MDSFASYFVERMDDIIRKCSPTDKDNVAYRGLVTLHRDDKVGDAEGSKGFSSMSFSLDAALAFSEQGGYIEKVIIPRGSHVIFNHRSRYISEFELIPPPNSLFKVLRGCKTRTFIDAQLEDIRIRECITKLLS